MIYSALTEIRTGVQRVAWHDGKGRLIATKRGQGQAVKGSVGGSHAGDVGWAAVAQRIPLRRPYAVPADA